MYHTSPTLIIENTINKNGIAFDCLFFSDEIYSTSTSGVYVYEADFNCVDAWDLYDDEILQQITALFDCDEDTAIDLLTSEKDVFSVCDDYEMAAEKSWMLQGLRGECAKKNGV